MTTARPSIQKSMYGSAPSGFQGITNYSNPNIVGIVTKRLHSNSNGYYNSFGDWITKVSHIVAPNSKRAKEDMAKKEAALQAEVDAKNRIAGISAEESAAVANDLATALTAGKSLSEAKSYAASKAEERSATLSDNAHAETGSTPSSSTMAGGSNMLKMVSIAGLGIIGVVVLIKILKK